MDHRTGTRYVAFENSNTDGQVANRYAIVSSTDGGATFSTPSFVTDVFDGNTKYPVCAGSQTLDVMCAQIDAAGNLDIDQNTGQLYISFADNRNGTATDTNNDVFVTTSNNGGRTWSKPVNLTADSVGILFGPPVQRPEAVRHLSIGVHQQRPHLQHPPGFRALLEPGAGLPVGHLHR